jgi:SAM-dependent methyltransferase
MFWASHTVFKKIAAEFLLRFAFYWALAVNSDKYLKGIFMTDLPWYIDPDLVAKSELTLHPDDHSVVSKYSIASNQLLADPQGQQRVVNRFRENGTEMINEINGLNPNLVIDLACGMNPYRGLINNLVSSDITPHQNVDWVCDFKYTPFRDSVADVILLMNGYAFFRRNRDVFQEIRRIARPGCRVYCRTANKAFITDNITDGSRYIKNVARDFGFAWQRPLKFATFTDPEDQGVYFEQSTRPIWHRHRVRFVWTWRVVK